MEHYYKLAAMYFQEFEPRNSLPGLKSCHWYLWALSLGVFSYFIYDHFFLPAEYRTSSFWQMFGSEAAFLLSSALIFFERFRLIVKATGQAGPHKPIDRLNSAKRLRLEALLGRPASQFMGVAQELIELRQLQSACRSAVDRDMERILTKVYDPESKARLVTLMTALLGLVIAVLGKNEALNFIEAFSHAGILALLAAVAQMALILFILGFAGFMLLRQILALLLFLASSLFPGLSSRKITLDYFISDLVLLHILAPARRAGGCQAASRSADHRHADRGAWSGMGAPALCSR